MNVLIPEHLADALNQRAEQRQLGVEALVREALAWYLSIDPELMDELAAWQELRDEAFELIELASHADL